MNSSSSLCCSLLLFTLCLTLISHSANANPAMISQICKATLEDQFDCLNVLRSDPRILTAKNYLEFTQVVLEIGINKATEGKKFLQGIELANKTPQISECANFDIDGVLIEFRGVMSEMKSDPQSASYSAKTAGDGPAACERGLADAHIVNPAISALNKQLMLLSNIAFLAVSKI